MRRHLLALFLLVFLQACASTPLDRYLEKPSDLPETAKVEGVPYHSQERNHCGPATLAMVMEFQGKKISPEEIADKLFTPGEEGSFQMDMIGASRREGFMAIPIHGYDSLFKELAAGNPVVVFENLGLSWWSKWHYAVALGYNLPEKMITFHSGDDPDWETDLKRFERDWSGGDHWGLVVLPPNKLSASAGEIDHLQSAIGLERVGLNKEAQKAYETILLRWPNSLGALIGLGNTEYAQNNFSGATKTLKRATHLYPKSKAAQNNLKVATTALRAQRTGKRVSE